MAEVTISIPMDEELAEQFERLCLDSGVSVSTAICMFAEEMLKTRKFPFALEPDLDFRE